MLNESAYKATYDEKVGISCPFEKAILSRCANCEQARKLNIAEREAVACKSALAREACLTLHALLHQKAMFVVRLTHPGDPLPHAKEIKVQCGGLLGVQRLVDPEANSVDDVHALVTEIQAVYGDLREAPYQEVVKEVAVYEGRRRRS